MKTKRSLFRSFLSLCIVLSTVLCLIPGNAIYAASENDERSFEKNSFYDENIKQDDSNDTSDIETEEKTDFLTSDDQDEETGEIYQEYHNVQTRDTSSPLYLNYSELAIEENSALSITATTVPSGAAVSWSSSI